MHKKFEINQTKIKGSCQSGRKVVTHDSKSDLPLYMFKTAPENWVPLLIAQSVLNAGIFVFKKQTLVILKCTYVLEFRYDSRMFFLQFILR